MRTIRMLAALALLVLPTACGPPAAPTAPAAVGDLLPAEVVEFSPDGHGAGYGRGPVAALSAEPITLGEFAGRAAAPGGAGSPVPAAEPGRAYLVVAGYSGCRLATGVEVRRAGDDLRVTFTGGADHVECARPYLPSAVLSLPAVDVAGVRTIDGRAPVAATGPGTLTAFVPLGPGPADRVASVELGTVGVDGLVEEVGQEPRARSALERTVPSGVRAFAFLLTGCAESGAVLLLDDDRIWAEPVGGVAECEVPDLYLATFEVPTGLVPSGAALG